jgi:putative acetyltransferase
MPPYPLPDAYAGAWQSIALGDRTPRSHGTLVVSPTWQQPTLWGP